MSVFCHVCVFQPLLIGMAWHLYLYLLQFWHLDFLVILHAILNLFLVSVFLFFQELSLPPPLFFSIFFIIAAPDKYLVALHPCTVGCGDSFPPLRAFMLLPHHFLKYYMTLHPKWRTSNSDIIKNSPSKVPFPKWWERHCSWSPLWSGNSLVHEYILLVSLYWAKDIYIH